jgi:aspartate/methionine/tyrosine aminotransferase
MLVESPTYFGAIAIARQLGIRVVPVPVDEEGIRVDLAAAALTSSGARAIYVQPAFANPTGIVTSPERRRALLELARRTGSFVVEDDYARDLAFASAPPPPMFREGGDAVVYVRSLTKAAAPGLRVAAVVARGPVAQRLATLRAVEDMFVSGLLQETALELVTSSAWDAHLRALRAELRRRLSVLVEALGEHFPAARVARPPEGGFAAFVDLSAAPPEVVSNVLVATLHPLGLRPHIVNFEEVAALTLDRTRREAARAGGDEAVRLVMDRIAAIPDLPRPSVPITQGPFVTVHLKRGSLEARLFTTIATIGTAIDATAEDLRIETYFPADDATARLVKSLAAGIA